MKILILSDSYKGTLSSSEVMDVLRMVLHEEYPDATIYSFPFSDGGENALDCYKSVLKEAKEITLETSSPDGKRKQKVSYLINQDIAIIESAKAIGLMQVEERNPFLTSSSPLGEVLLSALDHDIHSFILTLGGTCTNDGGCGMLSAFGVRFLDSYGNSFVPTGGTLGKIEKIETSHLDSRLKDCHFSLLSDCTNPLLGENGASHVFSKQKGASTKEDRDLLEKNMSHYASLLENETKRKTMNLPGMGAAGGLPFGISQFFDFTLSSGAEEILSLYQIDSLLDEVDLLITGEGKTDSSSLDGKCISVLASHAKKKNKKVLLISGYIEPEIIPELHEIGITDCLSVEKEDTKNLSYLQKHAKEHLRNAFRKYLKEGNRQCFI